MVKLSYQVTHYNCSTNDEKGANRQYNQSINQSINRLDT